MINNKMMSARTLIPLDLKYFVYKDMSIKLQGS